MNQMILRRSALLLLPLLVFLFGTLAAESQSGDVIFRAIQDEMQRTMSDLVMEDLNPPYFVAYTVDDFQQLEIKSSLGNLVNSKIERSRYLTVDLRVGDDSLDNSNFSSGFSYSGPVYSRISIENDYDAIRNTTYLQTDRSYKQALKMLSKKEAYLQGRVIKNRPDDFINQPEYRFTDDAEDFDVDQGYFDELARAASGVFKDHPEINFSQVEVNAAVSNQYMVNSNGSKSLRGDRLYTVRLSMTGKGVEGEDVSDEDHIIVKNLADLPDREHFVQWAKENAERMSALISGGEIEEYAGPVILEGDAAGEFFRQLFAKHVSNMPAHVSDNERMAQMLPQPEFGNKVKRRVLPAFIDVYDDPTINELDDMKLVGGYEVDDAGNPPVRTQLVDKGKLVSLLIGTAPTKKIKEPNGHARGSVGTDVSARPGNLIIESTDEVSFEELKASMLEFCQDIDLEYGLVIRRLTDPNAPSTRMQAYFGGGQPPALTAPLEAYKVFPDGHEEPVRNLEFSNVTVRILRDILQTGDASHVYNYCIGNDFEMPISIVCPAILVEEMELKKSEEKVRKPPILPSPLADK